MGGKSGEGDHGREVVDLSLISRADFRFPAVDHLGLSFYFSGRIQVANAAAFSALAGNPPR